MIIIRSEHKSEYKQSVKHQLVKRSLYLHECPLVKIRPVILKLVPDKLANKQTIDCFVSSNVHVWQLIIGFGQVIPSFCVSFE